MNLKICCGSSSSVKVEIVLEVAVESKRVT